MNEIKCGIVEPISSNIIHFFNIFILPIWIVSNESKQIFNYLNKHLYDNFDRIIVQINFKLNK